jgi:hypothetical protein
MLMELLERIFPIRMDHLDPIAKVSLHLESFRKFSTQTRFSLELSPAEATKTIFMEILPQQTFTIHNKSKFLLDVTTSD